MPKSFINMFRGDATPIEKRIKEEPLTPSIEDFDEFYDFNKNSLENYGAMRRSLSTNDIATLQEELINMKIKDERKSGYHRSSATGSSRDLSRTKFVSMAEAVYNYQRATPGRFHSKGPTVFQAKVTHGPSGLTIPQSPMLRCKTRSRRVNYMSQKEKEELELESIKQFKIKANPVPKSVIDGPINLPEVPKKPATVPEPFKLTEIPKKVVNTEIEIHKFKARPVPKTLEKPHLPEKKPVTTTIAVSPNFRFKPSNRAPPKTDINKKTSKSAEKLVRLHPVKPEPFSFEKRDEELRRSKEEKIKKEIEDQRKQASQFKAQPLPMAVKKQMKATVAKGSSSTASSENKENNLKFEARPPLVLYKEPFKPIYQHNNIVKPAPFHLTTEKRAIEREKFDHMIKEKEDEMEKLRLLKEQELQEAEERATSELRATLVHHAKPLPVISPFIPEKSDAPLTVPQTPKFIKRMKQI